MARILGFQYGEMRGKLGGNVFSRNKAGAYVRAKVTPVNPQTVRQQTARYRFGNMSILYQSLSNMAKDCWQTFASTHFNPLKGNNTGIYTGGNAFVALRQSAAQGNDYSNINEITSDGTATTLTQLNYNATTEPPSAPTSATIIDSNAVAQRIEVDTIVIREDGSYDFNIKFPDASPTSTATFSAFLNAEEQNFGIGIYISNNLKFEGAKPNTALKLNIGDTKVISAITKVPSGAPIISESTVVTMASSIVHADVRDFPCVDDWVLATPFVRSIDGSQKMMAPMYVKVQAV